MGHISLDDDMTPETIPIGARVCVLVHDECAENRTVFVTAGLCYVLNDQNIWT